jgi:hypothetical protein
MSTPQPIGPFSVLRAPPATFARLLDAAYAGAVHHLPPTPASVRLVAQVQQVLTAALGPDPREAQHRMTNRALFERLSPVRRALYCDPEFQAPLVALVAELGGDPTTVAFDPLRLRVIRSRGHVEVPAARAVYYPHRDTWYAHPSAVVTWWIPLDDLAAEETFVFYPERFATPVPNDSETFDYDDWVRDGWELKIGWQRAASGLEARYPGTLGRVDGGAAVGFSCRRGENLLFAGAHFHQTLPQETGRTRFSLDFRLVHLADAAAGRGAPNVDGRSRGSALRDYVRIAP